MGRTHDLYTVIYPDQRRGPNGESTALFRYADNAMEFCHHNKGRIYKSSITVEHLKWLTMNNKLEGGDGRRRDNKQAGSRQGG